MPLEEPVRVVRALTSRGYNAEREAVTLLADAPDSAAAVERVVDAAPVDTLTITTDHVRATLADDAEPAPDPEDTADTAKVAVDTTKNTVDTASNDADARSGGAVAGADESATDAPTPPPDTPSSDTNSSASSGAKSTQNRSTGRSGAVETKGVDGADGSVGSGSGGGSVGGGSGGDGALDAASAETPGPPTGGVFERRVDEALRELEISNDVTGQSTGTGEYGQFVSLFRDRYERLSKQLRGRVNHRPTNALESMPGGSDAAIVGMVDDVRSTKSGHWIVDLEDTNGTFPALIMKDRDWSHLVDELLMDEVVAVEGSLSNDGGILFADSLHFPDVPRTFRPSTADRHVQAALISDVHVGSQEFERDAWHAFADWLHTEEAQHVEYLLVGGDMVEGVGVYPNQDEELDVVDIYEQYERFAEYLKEVPGDMEIVMIPGNHDAVRLAEPQPGFDEELRDIMSAHDARITGNPSTVTVEGVDVLMYHGVSIDEMVAELPDDKASYDRPHDAMAQLLKKRHVAPQYGGHMRIAPEEKDYLVIDDVPDIFHTGHVHKLGVGEYHNVRLINSGCWQAQTSFQKSVNIQPDVATAPIVDLDTLDVTVRTFRG